MVDDDDDDDGDDDDNDDDDAGDDVCMCFLFCISFSPYLQWDIRV